MTYHLGLMQGHCRFGLTSTVNVIYLHLNKAFIVIYLLELLEP
jgi:hypothetical protein